MKNALFATASALILFSSRAFAQEPAVVPGLEMPARAETGTLPSHIPLYDLSVPLLSGNTDLFDPRMVLNRQPEYKTNLWQWQQNYIRANNLRGIPAAPTLMDGSLMEFAMALGTRGGQELYRTYMVMNLNAAGGGQLETMNVRMRPVRSFDFIGPVKVGVMFIAAPDNAAQLFDPRIGTRRAR